MPWEIIHKGTKWNLYLKGKLFASHNTKKEAIAHYQAIEISKNKRKGSGFKEQNEEAKRLAKERTQKEAKDAKAYYEQQRAIHTIQPMNDPEQEAKEDQDIIDTLDLGNLSSRDRDKIDRIHNDKIRSRLQHELNLSGFYKNLKEVNKPSYDDMVAGLYDMVLGELPYVNKVKNSLGISVSNKEGETKKHFNNEYQKLLEQYPELQDGPYSGGGLFGDMVNKAKNFFSRRLEFNNTCKKTLEKFGNVKIINITLFKKPIQKWLDFVLNLLSLGKFNEAKSQDFDKLFHTGLIFNLEGSVKVLVEKVEEVMITTNISNAMGKDSQFLALAKPKETTMNQVFQNAIQQYGNELFFGYSAMGSSSKPRNNCQDFIKMICNTMGNWDGSAEKFIFQDLTKLSKEMPNYVKTIANTATNLGNIVSKWRGAGKMKQDGYELHAVVVKKPTTKQDAFKIGQHFIKNKRRTFIRETAQSYRCRNLPKTQFTTGSFKTKKINNMISLIYGKLK